MAEMVGYPTDGAEGSVATEAKWRAMARLWAPSGVVAGSGGELAPTLGAGVINVAVGAAWVDGHYCELTTPASESSTANGLLVVRFTPADNLFELVYRDGVSAPTQTDAIWELPIARMTGGVMTDIRRLIPVGGSGLVQIAQVTLAAAAAQIVIADIPQTFSNLRLMTVLRSDAASSAVVTMIHLNGDTAGNYDHQTLRGTGTTTSAVHTASDSGIRTAIPGASAWPAAWGPGIVDLPGYRLAGIRRPFLVTYSWNTSTGSIAGSGDFKLEHLTGWWRSTATVSSIVIDPASGNLAAGSTATLYGM